MQKVEGSSPFIRFTEQPRNKGVFLLKTCSARMSRRGAEPLNANNYRLNWALSAGSLALEGGLVASGVSRK